MDYRTNIWHQRVVAILGTQNPSLRIVYAHIANYTQVKGAWCGSQRDLAAQLELPIGTINNQLTELINKGLIVRDVNCYRSADEQKCSAGEQKRSAGEQNPDTIIKNNKMENNELNARANMRDAIPQNPSFLDLKSLFLSKGGKSSDINEPKALEAWNLASPIKRRRLLEAVQSSAHFKRCLDWLIADFPEPQPEFLSGAQQEQNWKDGIPMVQVKVGNRFLICTSQTQQEFNLPLVKPWPKKED